MSASVWNVPTPDSLFIPKGLMRLELEEDRVRLEAEGLGWHRFAGTWNGNVVRWEGRKPPIPVRVAVNRWLREATQEPEDPESTHRYPEPKEHLFLDGKPVKGDDS